MQVAMTGEEFKRRFLPLSRKLYGVALSLSGDMQEAEDIVQDVYMKLWTRRDRLPSDVNDEAYCDVVSKNVYNDRSAMSCRRIFRRAMMWQAISKTATWPT